MAKIAQNLVILMDPTKGVHDVSFKAGNMCFNRFTIDENAAFEFSGVYYLKSAFIRNDFMGFKEYIAEHKAERGMGYFSLQSTFSDHKLTFELKVDIISIVGYSHKEKCDGRVIDSAFAKIVESDTKNMEIHFVAAVYSFDRMKSAILKGMKKYKIKKVMLTTIRIERRYLITKEKMEDYSDGKLYPKDSVNDDLESIFEDVQNGKEPAYDVRTYFLPKLTKEELEMVEKKDENFMETFFGLPEIVDVDEEEMKASESDSKYVYGQGRRTTITIENS